jgi:transcription elongation factor GreA
MNEKIYLTAEGAEKMRTELAQLKGPARDDMAKRLRSAIQQGDLSENADYHKAKEDQGFLEGRIQELDYLLEKATIIESNAGVYEMVDIGAVVTVREADYPADSYRIVGSKEADPQNGKLSNESPIGKALMGKKVGDRVQVETPAGEIRLEIIKIE